MTDNGHAGIDSCDSLITVCHIEGHRSEVRIVIGELICGETHVCTAIGIGTFHHIGTGSRIATTEGEIRAFVQCSAESSVEASHSM